MNPNELELLPGPSGWVTALYSDGSEQQRCFIQLAPDAAGRWTWMTAQVTASAGAAPTVRIPVRRIELAVNASSHLIARLTERLDEPAGNPHDFDGRVTTVSVDPIALTRPAGKRLTDEWYRQVAEAYRTAAQRGLNPRATIAEAANVSTDVAGRWVYEARKRGFLPPTSPGKVTTHRLATNQETTR